MNKLAQNLTFPSQPCPPGATCPPPIVIQGPLKSWVPANFGDIINRLVPFVFGFAGLALLLMLIAGGFGVLTSSGDAKKLEAAKQRLSYAILGTIIIVVAYFLVQVVAKIFGLQNIGF